LEKEKQPIWDHRKPFFDIGKYVVVAATAALQHLNIETIKQLPFNICHLDYFGRGHLFLQGKSYSWIIYFQNRKSFFDVGQAFCFYFKNLSFV
jgi:hypothetical protein